jgi:ribulose-phosphate 3-epimerase
LVEVDGGVNLRTGSELVKAGADVLVSGSFIFGSPDPLQTIKEFKALK